MPDFDEAHVLALAALASSEGGQDPVDEAIQVGRRGQARRRHAEVDRFHAVRPGDKNVRGERRGFERGDRNAW